MTKSLSDYSALSIQLLGFGVFTIFPGSGFGTFITGVASGLGTFVILDGSGFGVITTSSL